MHFVSVTSLFLLLGANAETLFKTLRKKYQRKKNNLKTVNKSGNSADVVVQAEKALNSYKFLSWLDEFIQVRQGRSNLPRSQIYADSPGSAVNEIETWERDEDLESENNENIEKDGENENESKKSRPINNKKRKLSDTARGSLLEEMEYSVCSDIKSLIKVKKESSKQEVVEDSEDLFCKTIASELKALPPYEKIMAKHEIRNVISKFEMMAMSKKMTAENCSSQSIAQTPQVNKYNTASFSTLVSPPPTPNPNWQNPDPSNTNRAETNSPHATGQPMQSSTSYRSIVSPPPTLNPWYHT